MRYVCYVISALLAMALGSVVGVGQEAETEPAAAPEEVVEEAPAPAPPVVDAEQMRKSVVERLAQARAEWLGRARVALGVESDDAWAKMEPLILRLEQLQRIKEFMAQKGQVLFYAQGMSSEELMTGAERMQEQFASFNPDLAEDDINQLTAAHAGLVAAFHDKDATEEQVYEAITEWRRAAIELEARADQARAQLAKIVAPRQQVGLVLMGMLDARATASAAP